MSERQIFVDKVRSLITELEGELVKPKHFTKDVEPFTIKEAIFNLQTAEKHLNSYLQVDKARGK